MLMDTASRASANQTGLMDTNRAAKAEKAPVQEKAAPAAPKKSNAGRKKKEATVAAAKPAPEPEKIPASFPARVERPKKVKVEAAVQESHTDSGSEKEVVKPAARAKKAEAAPVKAAAPAKAEPAAAAPEKPKRAKFEKGSEEAKKYMAELRQRRMSKKEPKAEEA